MKAPSFAYVRARSLSELFELLEDHGDGARLLAGGCGGGTALLVPFQLFTGKLAWLGD